MLEEKTIRVPVKECNQGTTQLCENYEVPKQEVVSLQDYILMSVSASMSTIQQSTPESASMKIAVENCDIVEEKKQYCANLPTEVLCSNTTVSIAGLVSGLR